MVRPFLVLGEELFSVRAIVGVGLDLSEDPWLGVLRMLVLRGICCPLDSVLKVILSLIETRLVTKQQRKSSKKHLI